MRKCSKCKISYTGSVKRCPLCQSELIGDITASPFPKTTPRKENVLYKILLFVSISLSLIFAFVEYMIHNQFTVTKYVVLGIVTLDILVLYIIKKYKNVLKKMNKYFIIILLLTFLWFFLTKSLIITTYIIPILCIIIFLFNSITMLVLKDSYISRFLGQLLLDCVIGLIPGVLLMLHLTTTNVLSYICLLLDVLVLLGLIIFCHDRVIEELTKRFNI